VKSFRQILFMLLRAAVGVGILVYLGVSRAINWSSLWGLASAWPVTLVAFLLLLLAVVATAWRLCVLLRPHGLHLSLGGSLRLTLIGTFFNCFLLGSAGGDLVKLYYVAQGNHGRRTEATTIVLFDRAVGMFALLILPLLVSPLFAQLLSSRVVLRRLLLSAALIALAMVAGTLVCFSIRVRNSRLLSWIFHRLPGGFYGQKMFDTVHAYRHSLGTLGVAVGISLVAHTITIGVTLLAARATNPSAVAWEMSVLIPLGFFVNTLPFTPGGLGVGEAAFDALFAMAGRQGGAEALLGWRLLTMLAGLFGLVFYLQGRRRFVYSAGVSPTLDPET